MPRPNEVRHSPLNLTSMHSTTPKQSNKPRQTRKRGPNVKTGCATCKIRRKKCDEKRPACLQCTSTSRTCDFLQPLENRTIQIPMKPHSLLIIPPEEVVHFDYFRMKCTEEFSNSFNDMLWKQLVLQAMHTEPFVLNAALAIGALRRYQLESEGSTVPPSTIKYSIGQYSKASKELSNRLSTDTADWKLAVLGSIVFLAIEVLQGNESGALMHFRSGLEILKSLSGSTYDTRSSSSFQTANQVSNVHSRINDFDLLASAFTRLSVEECSFTGSNISTAFVAPNTPARFDSIAKARSSLNTILTFVYAFLRRSNHEDLKTLPFHSLPEEVATELSQTQTVLQSWHQALNAFLSKSRNVDTKTRITAKMLLVQHLVMWIKVSTHFFSEQTIYDSYLSHFAQIVDMTTAIVEADNASWTKSKGPCYTLDVAMVQPLYFVALRCRDPVLRQRTIGVMRKVGKEGVYTGRMFARVAEWVVRMEEGVDEVVRFYDVVLHEVDEDGRRLVVEGKRKGRESEWVCLVEELDSSR